MYKTAIICLFLVVFVAGCRKDAFKGPPLHPCNVTVHKSGKPIDGVAVVFTKKDGGSDFNIIGRTNSQGTAAMKVDARYDGVPAGNYVVRLLKPAEIIHTKTEEEQSAMGTVERMKYDAEREADRAKRSTMIPPSLRETETSKVEMTVASGNNSLIVELNDHQ